MYQTFFDHRFLPTNLVYSKLISILVKWCRFGAGIEPAAPVTAPGIFTIWQLVWNKYRSVKALR